MTTVTVTNEVSAPIDSVFAQFTDVERAAQDVSSIRGLKKLTPGPFGLGTRWEEVRQVLGHLDRAEMEVTAFERNRTYTITHHKGGVRINTVFRFEPSGDKTKVTIEFALDSQGLPPGFLAPVGWAMAGKVRDVLSSDLAELKDSVEKRAG